MVGKKTNRIRKWLGGKDGGQKLLIPLAMIVTLFILGRLIEVEKYLQILQKWLWTLGPWAPMAFIGIYVAAMLLFLPGTPFTIAAAFLFGTRRGYFIMVAASTIAAVIGFLVARYVARKTIEERYSDIPNFLRLRKMVEKNHRIAILFVRVMPFFPFAINNYALGLTRISFWSYLFYSELVFLPMNAALVFGAYAIYRVMAIGETPWLLISISSAGGFLILGVGFLGRRVFGRP